MVSAKVKITDKAGIHMRPANNFISAMVKYRSDIKIIHGGNEINGKSIMNIMAAGLKYGNEIEIICTGEDEKEMLKEAVNLIENGLEK